MQTPTRETIRRAAGAGLWLVPAALAAAWMGAGLCSPRPLLSDEPLPDEVSGQVSWVDPQASAFGLDVKEEEMEFSVGPETAITRDGKKITLGDVQPGDWAASCAYRLQGERRLCLRLEIQTPPEEEGLE